MGLETRHALRFLSCRCNYLPRFTFRPTPTKATIRSNNVCCAKTVLSYHSSYLCVRYHQQRQKKKKHVQTKMQDYDAFTGRNWFSPSFQHKKRRWPWWYTFRTTRFSPLNCSAFAEVGRNIKSGMLHVFFFIKLVKHRTHLSHVYYMFTNEDVHSVVFHELWR